MLIATPQGCFVRLCVFVKVSVGLGRFCVQRHAVALRDRLLVLHSRILVARVLGIHGFRIFAICSYDVCWLMLNVFVCFCFLAFYTRLLAGPNVRFLVLASARAPTDSICGAHRLDTK